MTTERFVGTNSARLFAMASASLFFLGLYLHFAIVQHATVWLSAALLIFGLVTLASFTHTDRRIYTHYMAFAEKLNTVMTTLLFSMCYLIVVPPFALIIAVGALSKFLFGSKKRGGWMERPQIEHDKSTMERLG